MRAQPIGKTTAIRIKTDQLLMSMVPEYAYTQDEVCALLYDTPKCAVKEALHTLIDEGKVWRDTSTSKVKYLRLSAKQLKAMHQRKADRVDRPAWMKNTLKGYTESLAQHRELAMMARRA